jgi:uncharacterized protein (DUF433 family)
MDTPTPTNWKYLEPRPGSFYRQLWIKGRRIRAEILYGDYMRAEEPWSPEEIAEQYDLPLEAVKEAIAYCESNPPEIEGDHRREDALAEATGMNDPNYNGKPRVLSPEERARIRNL